MDRIIERCAGLDVHKDSVTACVRVPGERGERRDHLEQRVVAGVEGAGEGIGQAVERYRQSKQSEDERRPVDVGSFLVPGARLKV